jgi:hypothetical protein
MADRTLRPTEKVLRLAGLLQNQPAHHIARGHSVPPQPALVSKVFGPLQAVGEKTLIPMSSVRSIIVQDGRRISKRTPVAIVELSAKGVRVHALPTPPVKLAGILLACWTLYWVLRTVREWRANQR